MSTRRPKRRWKRFFAMGPHDLTQLRLSFDAQLGDGRIWCPVCEIYCDPALYDLFHSGLHPVRPFDGESKGRQ